MDASIVIVTKNRAKALAKTLGVLLKLIDVNKHEVLIFIDGCSQTHKIKEEYKWVRWFSSVNSIGASPARNALYKHAKGDILIGFDDDAHPITKDFILKTDTVFNSNSSIGIIAFQEIRGVYSNDEEALKQSKNELKQYLTSDFIGCGFAIKKDVYNATNGFPLWMDIYGEEGCVALEVINNGYDILYDNSIIVNHRVDKKDRTKKGKYYFRFEKQLVNTINYYLVYYKKPLKPIMKTIYHNFKKYALSDFKYFRLFFKAIATVFLNFNKTRRYREPIKSDVFSKIKALKPLKY